jgi:hypothetical protein
VSENISKEVTFFAKAGPGVLVNNQQEFSAVMQTGNYQKIPVPLVVSRFQPTSYVEWGYREGTGQFQQVVTRRFDVLASIPVNTNLTSNTTTPGINVTVPANASNVSNVTLMIFSSPGGAEVRVGSRWVGTTPLNVSVAPGTYDIRLTKTGYESESHAVSAQSNRTLNYSLDKISKISSASSGGSGGSGIRLTTNVTRNATTPTAVLPSVNPSGDSGTAVGEVEAVQDVVVADVTGGADGSFAAGVIPEDRDVAVESSSAEGTGVQESAVTVPVDKTKKYLFFGVVVAGLLVLLVQRTALIKLKEAIP